MKTRISRRSKVEGREPEATLVTAIFRFRRSAFDARPNAFTLIEIMIVVGIMGIILAMGTPSFIRSMRKEGMRKAVEDITEACSHARANAILTGASAELIIHPHTGSIELAGSSAPAEHEDSDVPRGKAVPFSATLPSNIVIELLGVNFVELQEAEEARVKFYPNGTSDEFTILIRSETGEVRKISLEIITALADVEVVK